MRETWYVLEDGSLGDPRDVSLDGEGLLRHKNGAAVAMRAPGVPHSRGVDDADAERVKAAESGAPKKETSRSSRSMKADDDKAGYKTRETKAD